MRALFLTDSLSDLDGVGRYAIRLIAALESQRPDLEVEILLARKHRPTSAQVPAHWKVEVALPPDYFYYMSPPRFWVSLLQSLRKVKEAARGADLIHAIKDYPHNWLGLCAARSRGIPCVATFHGTYTVQPLLSDRHAARAARAYREFAAMISVSAFTRDRVLEEMARRGEQVDQARIHVVPNAVDAGHYLARRDVGERPWHDVPFTLSIGELKERKGHHVALAAWCRAARDHPDLHHFVLGKRAGGDYERQLVALAEREGLADRIHFLGNVTEDEKVDLLQRALVFLHTPVTASDGGFEGFGIVYLEAAASGTPTLGTLGCGAEDAIRDGVDGFLTEPTAEAVEPRLRELLGDEALRERFGDAGRARAAGSTWEDNARRVLEIYGEALG